jgi:hypothetical protein
MKERQPAILLSNSAPANAGLKKLNKFPQLQDLIFPECL